MATDTPATPAPDLSEAPDARPGGHRRWLVAAGITGVLLIGGGVALASADDDPEAQVMPAETMTVTETVAADPAPAETVTVTAEPEPAETVTVTAEPEPAETVTVTAEPEPAETVTVTAEPLPAETVTVAAEPEPDSEPEPEPAPAGESSLTRAQENALGTARDYLEYSSFSRTGLIGQLEYEGFSNGDATFAVDALDVDWKEQAALMAEDYLEYSSFSRSGLIDQLEYEGFTPKQARYGVDQTGL